MEERERCYSFILSRTPQEMRRISQISSKNQEFDIRRKKALLVIIARTLRMLGPIAIYEYIYSIRIPQIALGL
jgi:hypothetical protein